MTSPAAGVNEAGSDSATIRLLVVGASATAICGVRDCSRVLTGALTERGLAVSTAWWERGSTRGLRCGLRGLRSWRGDVSRINSERGCDIIVWHYSVFTHSLRGVPLLAPLMARSLNKLGVPVVLYLHEFVYPFGRSGWRGLLWALSQRAALRALFTKSAGAVATTQERAGWIAGRVWLPRRPIAFVPVFSNLPPQPAHPDASGELKTLSLGVLGFGSEGTQVDTVIGALRGLPAHGIDGRLLLLGAPGPDGAHGEAWRRSARRSGCEPAVSFTGIRQPQELAQDLAAVDVVVFPEVSGPTSRRGTLAASLACGKPIVALDGPDTWRRFIDERAMVLVPDSSEAMLEEIVSLAEDPSRRRALGGRARDFYCRYLAPAVAATTMETFLRSLRVDGAAQAVGRAADA
ncbi:MAG: hypothetical protein NVSMB32_00920 [Actinomycetota bacterium]